MNKKNVKIALGVALVLSLLAAVGCSNKTSSGTDKLQKVRFSEVIHSIFYAPHYIAMEKGFFKEEGLEVDMVTAQGSDKGAAALLAGTADVSLIGPETTLYIFNQKGGKTLKAFHQLTFNDGSFLMSRSKLDSFNWSDLAGKTVIGWRPGSAPQMVMNSVLKRENVTADVITNIAATAMVGAFASGKGDFIQVYEPLASTLESEGKAYYAASLGEAMSNFPETSFIATSDYIKKNPKVIENWSKAVAKATKWLLESNVDEVADALAPQFEGTSKDLIKKSIERYKKQNTWGTDPQMTEEQYANLEKVLLENGTLKEDQKVKMADVVDNTHAAKAAEGGK